MVYANGMWSGNGHENNAEVDFFTPTVCCNLLVFAHLENQYFASVLTKSKIHPIQMSGFKFVIDCIGRNCDID